MKTFICTLFISFGLMTVQAQDISVKAQLYKDTVGSEEYIKISFVVQNAQNVDFTAPAFKDFAEATSSGTSTNVSFINGQMTQSMSYNYILTHFGKGTYVIEPAIIEVEGEVYQSDILEVTVVEVAKTPDPMSEMDKMRSRFNMDMFNIDLEDLFNQMPSLEMPKELEDLIPKNGDKTPKGKKKEKKKKKKVYKI
ncbi:MAG: BatD family protein [Saprospiraceae bacterium]|mgnify:FL=1